MIIQANFPSTIMSVKAQELTAPKNMCHTHLPMYSPRRLLNVNIPIVRAVSLHYSQEKLTTPMNIKTNPSREQKVGRS
jgi:hypothetical protein